MKKLIITIVGGILLASAARAMSIAEVAELQFHQVDQLVARNKIDKGFVDHLASVALAKKPNSANFLVTFSQETNANQMANTVAIEATDAAKALSFKEVKGIASSNPVNWVGKAPLDILEKAVEFVVDTTGDARLVPFQNGFTGASILPMSSDQGLMAAVRVKATEQDGSLLLMVDLNGKVLSVTKE